MNGYIKQKWKVYLTSKLHWSSHVTSVYVSSSNKTCQAQREKLSMEFWEIPQYIAVLRIPRKTWQDNF